MFTMPAGQLEALLRDKGMPAFGFGHGLRHYTSLRLAMQSLAGSVERTLGAHLHLDSELVGRKQLAGRRPFVLALPVFEKVFGVKDATTPTRKVVD